MSFAPDDKVTLLINTQSHGTVLKSDEATTLSLRTPRDAPY
jgi:hypothetical protein